MKPTEAAYLAGLVDGEGCLIIRSKRITGAGNHVVDYHLEITMTDKEPIYWCQKVTSLGRLYRLYNGNRKRKQHSPVYRWTVSSQQAARVVQQILNFLINKRKQADLFLELSRIKGSYRTGHPQNFRRMHQILVQSRRLKGRASRATGVHQIPATNRVTKPSRDHSGRFGGVINPASRNLRA